MKPWYLNPIKTCAVLNRIARRFTFHQMSELRETMDQATMMLWSKQEQFYANQRRNF